MRLFIGLVGIVILIIIGSLVLKHRAPALPTAAEQLQQQQAQQPQAQTPTQSVSQTQAQPTKSATTTKNGMKIQTIKEGTGAEIKSGQTAEVQYEGKLADGTVFDATSKHPGGAPFSFKLGAHQVIEGWEEGVLGMKVGETRMLTIPPELAYGPQGYPPVIPQNATLTFTVTLVAIK